MIRHKWSGLIAVGLSVIAVLGVALGFGLASLHDGRASAQPSDDIVESVCQFEGASVSGLQLLPSLSSSTLAMVKSKDTEYWVNPQSKRVVMAFYGGNVAGNDAMSLTQEEARIIATKFAEKHCDSLPIFTLQRNEPKGFDETTDSTATVMRAYEFEWVQVLGGALTPNSVLVQVNPGTGKVMTYVCRYQPIEPAGTPSLTSEDAKAIAANRVLEAARAAPTTQSNLIPKVSFLQAPELRIVVKDGKQVLVWRVTAEAQGDLPWAIGGQYDISAQNGSVVEEYPFL